MDANLWTCLRANLNMGKAYANVDFGFKLLWLLIMDFKSHSL